jgi:uncharacterized membrane protein
MSSAEAPIFEALIVPYRSLTPNGALIVVSAVVVMTSAVALRFWLLGAWPVLMFAFVEIPLVVVLLTLNMRQARANELIMLDATNGTSNVVLTSQGRICEVGAFLHEQDKTSLFKSLETAIHRVNNPRFDNPQLRE